jgi:hypothetical protein
LRSGDPAPPRPAAEREVRCQVAGCGAPLREAGRYNVRNRLCPTHLRAPELHLANGAVARFCQVRPARSATPLATPRRIGAVFFAFGPIALSFSSYALWFSPLP